MRKLCEKFLEVSGRSEGVVDRNRDLAGTTQEARLGTRRGIGYL